MKPRVYVETSVVSCLTGRESCDVMILGNQAATREWWQMQRERYELVTSSLVIKEAGISGREYACDSLAPLASLAVVEPTDESEALGRALTKLRALPSRAVQDAAHIALAVTNGMDYLATWSFRHIANPANALRINQVCRDAGYRPTIICTPAQLMETQHEDPMITEIREFRDKQAELFGYDPAAIIKDARSRQKASGRPSVQYAPQRLEGSSTPKRSSGPRQDATTSSGRE